MAAGHDASAQQEYAMHLNQEQAAAAAGYEQVDYDQSGLTHEQLAVAAAHAATLSAYGAGQPAGTAVNHRLSCSIHPGFYLQSVAGE